ncbi:MAG: hypothetical protein IH944_08620 [Armatimonadetes bacterium]|nr:hypothetical protein [Armatimonadota bacterium]
MPANASTGEQNDSKGDRHDEKRWSFVALLFAFVALLLSTQAMNWTHPARVRAEWVLAGGAALFAVAFALWSSSRTSSRKFRLLLAAALAIALLALSVPVYSYYRAFADFPWTLLVPLFVVLLISGWVVRQRWLPVGCILIVALFIITANESAQAKVPSSITKDQVTVSIQELSRSGHVLFTVKSAPGTRIEEELDLENIEIEGRVCRVLPVTSWHPRPYHQDEDQLLPYEARLISVYFPPGWSKTIDFGIRVPKWPSEPAASVTVPVPQPDDKPSKREYESEGGGLRLNVKHVLWSISRHTWPAEQVLALTITYDGYRYSGWKGEELRVRDQNGRTLDLRLTGGGGTGNYCELPDLPPDATELTIDIFSEQQRDEASVSIRFGRLPID